MHTKHLLYIALKMNFTKTSRNSPSTSFYTYFSESVKKESFNSLYEVNITFIPE